MKADGPTIEFAQCFLRLANLPNFALDRLSRYEANLSSTPDFACARRNGPPEAARKSTSFSLRRKS
jgi:hypothetical protein